MLDCETVSFGQLLEKQHDDFLAPAEARLRFEYEGEEVAARFELTPPATRNSVAA